MLKSALAIRVVLALTAGPAFAQEPPSELCEQAAAACEKAAKVSHEACRVEDRNMSPRQDVSADTEEEVRRFREEYPELMKNGIAELKQGVGASGARDVCAEGAGGYGKLREATQRYSQVCEPRAQKCIDTCYQLPNACPQKFRAFVSQTLARCGLDKDDGKQARRASEDYARNAEASTRCSDRATASNPN